MNTSLCAIINARVGIGILPNRLSMTRNLIFFVLAFVLPYHSFVFAGGDLPIVGELIESNDHNLTYRIDLRPSDAPLGLILGQQPDSVIITNSHGQQVAVQGKDVWKKDRTDPARYPIVAMPDSTEYVDIRIFQHSGDFDPESPDLRDIRMPNSVDELKETEMAFINQGRLHRDGNLFFLAVISLLLILMGATYLVVPKKIVGAYILYLLCVLLYYLGRRTDLFDPLWIDVRASYRLLWAAFFLPLIGGSYTRFLRTFLPEIGVEIIALKQLLRVVESVSLGLSVCAPMYVFWSDLAISDFGMDFLIWVYLVPILVTAGYLIRHGVTRSLRPLFLVGTGTGILGVWQFILVLDHMLERIGIEIKTSLIGMSPSQQGFLFESVFYWMAILWVIKNTSIRQPFALTIPVNVEEDDETEVEEVVSTLAAIPVHSHVILSTGKKEFIWASTQVQWIVGNKKTSTVHLEDEKQVPLSLSIGQVESQLHQKEFLRVHRNHIIRLGAIEMFHDTKDYWAVDLAGRNSLRVGRAYVSILRKAISESGGVRSKNGGA